MNRIIQFSDVLNSFEEESKKSNSIRNKNLHLSELSICGFKYRYRLDNDLFIPFQLNYQIGNAFEFLIVKEMKKLGNIISQYTISKDDFVGHLDAYDIDNNIIYELKTSMSKMNFTDIYLRQLKIYMRYIPNAKGILWIYKPAFKSFTEKVIDHLNEEDYELIDKNFKAFRENKYIEGIENSLCSFCENTNCIMKGKKIESIY